MPGSLCLGPEWKSHFTSVTESAKRHCCVLVSPTQRAECWTSRGHEDNTTSWVVIQSLLAWKLRAFLVAQMVKNLPAMQETQVWSLGGEDPLEKGMATYSSILAWRIPWTEEPGRSTVHGVTKSRTWLNDWHFHFTVLLNLYSIQTLGKLGSMSPAGHLSLGFKSGWV